MRARLPMIFSITALLIAVLGVTPLGEAAYNAVVPKNSVGTPQLQRNAVKAAKIAPNAIRTGHVLDGTLLANDFKAGQIPQGPKGDKGDKGDPGTPAATFWANVSSTGILGTNSGATAASGTMPFTVTFNRSVADCAAVAVPAGGSLQSLVSGVTKSGSSVSIFVISRATGAYAPTNISVAVYC